MYKSREYRTSTTSIHRDNSDIIKHDDSCSLHYRRSKFCRGYTFSNIVKIVLFILDVQHYIPVKLTKTSGSPHLFKFTDTLNSEDIKLNKNYLWDTLEINWNKIKLTFNDSEIKLPRLVTIKM